MTFNRTFRTIAGVAAVAVATALGAGVAFAQPYGGHHGHGRGGADGMIGHLIAKAKDRLNLNTMQAQMFDTAVAHTKAARESGRALRDNVKAALRAELANEEPDLATVAASIDAVSEQARAQRNAVRAEWLALYATFNAEQKTVVRDILKQRMARMESFREKMREHMREKFSGKTG